MARLTRHAPWRRSFGTVIALAMPGGVALTLSAAQQQPAFRAETQTVAVYATVTDARGDLITNLRASDFQIQDDGRKRPITVFKSDVQPITVAIMLDRSPSLFPVAQRTQDTVGEFTRCFLAADRACLGTFSQVVSLDPTWSSNREVLLKHLGDDVPWPAGTAMWDAIDAARVALEHEADRRVILMVSDGADNCSRLDPRDVQTGLIRDDVMVYAVGFRGREGLASSDLAGLARATGGFSFELKPGDDLAATVRHIADELHRQYVLGFAPVSLDGKTHRIDVTVGKPGVTVRARRSYIAAKDGNVR
jgi:Ca-activated chloride channel family protein